MTLFLSFELKQETNNRNCLKTKGRLPEIMQTGKVREVFDEEMKKNY